MKYTGNVLPEIAKEEHDQVLNAKRMSLVSAATIYAVTNTTISLATIEIGAVEIKDGSSDTEATVGADGLHVDVQAIKSGSTIAVSDLPDITWASGATVAVSDLPDITWASGATVAVSDLPDITWASGATVAVSDLPDITWASGATVAVSNLPVASVASINGELESVTSKTLVHQPIAMNASGSATIFVPTNTFNITSIMLSANATVGVNLKSGVSYLTGNASLNMTLFPGGGYVESSGDLLNPAYNGMADASAFVIDLDDSVEVVGKVVYFEE